jgi:ABC-2 type transport system permease protein
MRKYWEMLISQMKINMAYSAWYWASTFSSLLQLIIIYYFWHAVYDNSATIENMPLNTMITYVVIAKLLGNYVAGVGDQLAANIRDGSVAIELMRPYDLLSKLVAIDLGFKLTSTVRDALPMLLLAFVFLGINLPQSYEAGILFVFSTIIGILIGTQFDLIVGVLAFWTINVWGLRVLRNAIMMFFTGSLIPISLFPEWLQTISQFLPFQSMVYVPVSIYTGTLSGQEAYLAMGIQLFWLIGIFILVRLVWSIALRKVTIFGG